MMYKVKRFFRRLKRLLQYIPMIWKTDDFDYGYSIQLFQYQLRRTADCIEENDYIENSKVVALKIRTACDLLDAGYNYKYVNEAEAQFERQYGESEVIFNETPEGNFDMQIWWPIAVDEDHNKEIQEYHSAAMGAAYFKSDRAKKLAWDYIHKNIDQWWD